MLRYDDDLQPKLNRDDALELIKSLHKQASAIRITDRKTGLVNKSLFKQKHALRTAVAELERFYIRAGIIPDERNNQTEDKKEDNKC